MSRTLKIVLAVVGGLLALCLCAAVIGSVFLGKTISNSVKSDPGAARDDAASIADFSMPAGFGDQGFSFNLLGYKIAPFTSEHGAVVMLMSLPAQASQAQNEQMVQRIGGQIGGSLGGQSGYTEVSRRALTLRGQPAELVVLEGTGKNGVWVREAMLTFVGKDGPAMLVFVAPASQWDEHEVDDLVTSIH